MSVYPRKSSKRKALNLDEESQSSKPMKKKKFCLKTDNDDWKTIEYLSSDTILEGMVILGCITEINSTCLKFALPGCLEGIVPIHHISSLFSTYIESVNSNKEKVNDSLHSMFKVGQTFACKVLDVKKKPKSCKPSIVLSINPTDVNWDLRGLSLSKNMVLNAVVKSIEDHGYVMDMGIDCVGFITMSNLNLQLKIGQVIQTVVSVSQDIKPVVSLKPYLKPVKFEKTSNVSLCSLMPGTSIDAFVQNVSAFGLLLNVIEFTGCICKEYCQQFKKYATDSPVKITGIVLYVHPLTHVIYLTLQKHPAVKLYEYKKWDIFDNASVVDVWRNSVILSLDKNVRGQAMKWELSDKKLTDLSAYDVNTVHKCLVLSIHPMDNMIRVTLKPSAFKKKIIKPEEICVGAIFKAKVKKYVKDGMVVTLSANIQGFVRNIHLTDGFIKDPELCFKLHSEVTCRVLFVNFSVTPSLLSLTCKKALLDENLPILSSYEDAYPGFITKGVVVDIMSETVLLSFFNKVQGIVVDLKNDTTDLKEMFFQGQVVECCVKYCNPDKKLLRLTLKIDSSEVVSKNAALDRTKAFYTGQVVDVVVKAKAKNGLQVQFLNSDVTAFLPRGHLSDIIEHTHILHQTYAMNDIIRVLVFSSKKTMIVTKKLSLIQHAQKNSVTSIDDLVVGKIMPVVAKVYKPGGLCVELGHNIVGFVPKKFIKDKESDSSERYQTYQTLMAKVMKLDKNLKKIKLSTRLCDVFDKNPDYSLDVLQCYLEDNEKIAKSCNNSAGNVSNITSLKVGTIVVAEICNITTDKIYCQLEGGASAIVDRKNCNQNVKTNQKCAGVVLFINYDDNYVELSFSMHLVKCVKAKNDSESSKVKLGQKMKCTAVFISKEFVLVHLESHAVGRFAYLPCRKIINDEVGRSKLYSLGQTYQIVIKRFVNDKVLGVLKKHDKIAHIPLLDSKNSGALLSPLCSKINENYSNNQCKEILPAVSGINVEKGLKKIPEIFQNNVIVNDCYIEQRYPVGKAFSATVIGKKKFQLNLNINNELRGRVHITNLGCASEGEFPIRKYSKGEQLEIEIIGFSDIKSHNYLPLSHRYFKKYAECRLSKSEVSMKDEELKPEAEVMGFVKEIGDKNMILWLTPKKQGELPFLHLPLQKKGLCKVTKEFKVGQAVKTRILSRTNCGSIVLSKLEIWKPQVGKKVLGYVQTACPRNGLIIELAHGYIGEIPICDISKKVNATGEAMKFLKNRFIQCNVLTVDDASKSCLVSIHSYKKM